MLPTLAKRAMRHRFIGRAASVRRRTVRSGWNSTKCDQHLRLHGFLKAVKCDLKAGMETTFSRTFAVSILPAHRYSPQSGMTWTHRAVVWYRLTRELPRGSVPRFKSQGTKARQRHSERRGSVTH